MTDYSASPTTLRRLANNMRVQQDFIEVEYELFDAIADKWEKDRAEVRKLRAVITAHNERVAAACKWRQDNDHCDYAKRGDLCPDCPREWEIEK